MIKNYLKIAFRSLVKQKVYTIINILGLAVGMASVVLIALHVEDELSYDKYHTKGDRIYKLFLNRLYPDHETRYANTPHSFAPVMVQDFPEVESAVRLFPNLNNEVMVRHMKENGEEIAFEESQFMFADSTFFDIFSLELIKGDYERALRSPQDIILTEETTHKYFGDEDPIDKELSIEFGGPAPFVAKVAGVIENVPENSHFEFDFIGSLATIGFIQNNVNFYSFSTHIYLLLLEGADPAELEAKFPDMVLKYAAPQIEQNLNLDYGDYVAAGNGYDYRLVSLFDIHLNPTKYQGQIKPGGSRTYVNIFILVATLILVIGCINFMNLATARSAERAREVGMRKTMGSLRNQLIWQFLIESIIISFFAMMLAILIVQLAIPDFNSLTQKNLSLGLSNSVVLPGLVAFSIVVGLLAGSYPAFVLSSFRPAEILKGNLGTKKDSEWLRNGLVVFQFVISIILITGTLIVQQQMSYIMNKNLGFDKDQVVVIQNAQFLGDQQMSFQAELRALPEVIGLGSTNAMPGGGYRGIMLMPEGGTEVVTVNGVIINDYYLDALGFEVIRGRGFSPDFNDSATVIINEQTLALLDVNDPIGLKLRLQEQNPQNNVELTIIGVVSDFHYMSLHNEISPFIFLSADPNNIQGLIPVRFEASAFESIIGTLESKWSSMVDNPPFGYTFFDEDLYNLYQNEARSAKILNVFSILAIIIACVGLFGLAAYTAGLRTKEIGVRKVLGASVTNVVIMLSINFTKLVLIAFFIAVPISWVAANKWLESFAYQTDIPIWVFALAGLTALIIAWGTVSYQSIKAAIVNPVNSLRSE